jgi:hypothetical protein
MDEVCEIVAAFFVDIIYNRFYPLADKYKQEGRYDTRTEAYKFIVVEYVKAIKNDNAFRRLIEELYMYYVRITKESTLLIDGFVERVTSLYIQKEFKGNFSNNQRLILFKKIIVECIGDFCVMILSKEVLHQIIDKNDKITTRNTRMFQDMLIGILKNKKESLQYELNKRILENPDSSKMTIMKDNIKRLTGKLAEERERSEKYKARLMKLEGKINDYIAANKELKKENDKLKHRMSYGGNNSNINNNALQSDQNFVVGALTSNNTSNTITQAIDKLNDIKDQEQSKGNENNENNDDNEEEEGEEEEESSSSEVEEGREPTRNVKKDRPRLNYEFN